MMEACANSPACAATLAADSAGLCSGCRSALYCSVACQRAAWRTHRPACLETRRRKDAAAAAAPTLRGAATPFGPTLAGAEAGDAIAQYNAGTMYATGAGVPRSYASAFTWWTRCAAQADAPRDVWERLGQCYRVGHGVAKDEVEAVRLLRVGADLGDAGAQVKLAECLSEAIGVPAPDFPAAFALYEAAAAQDDAHALLGLGFCYGQGRGVARDGPRAIAQYERAMVHPAAHQVTVNSAAYNLGFALMKGDGVPRDNVRGLACMRRAAAGGHTVAALLLRDIGL